MSAAAAATLDGAGVLHGGAGEGWQARLELKFEASESRTRLAHRRHHGPLLVQRLFHPEPRAQQGSLTAEPCHVYLLHPPGGVVSGDELQLSAEVGSHAHALLTTPAAGKFYRRGPPIGGEPRVARLTQTLPWTAACWNGCRRRTSSTRTAQWQLCTRVSLTGGARFIGWEIGCLGLPASEASLGDGAVRQSFELWRGAAPLLLERLNIERSCLAARWGLAGHSALGTWLAYPAGEGELALARAMSAPMNCADLTLACTLVDGALCCRGVAARADRLKQAFIDLWRALRPPLLGRAAIAPRIWAT
jgi:urease accessory protein